MSTLLRTLRAIGRQAALSIALLGLGAANATAGWVLISDPNTQDTATNPGSPKNQSDATVAAYAQDLLDLDIPLSLIASDDHYAGASLTGLGNPAASSLYVLAFHFGRGNSYWPHTGNSFDVFFSCMAECDNFMLPNSDAVGSYRLFDPPSLRQAGGSTGASVPEPATLALTLLGVGLAGFSTSRWRKTN